MRFFLVLLPCALAAAAGGCYGTSADSEESGVSGGGAGGNSGASSGGQARGGRSSGTSGSSSAGTANEAGSSSAGTGNEAGSNAGGSGGLVCDSALAAIDRSCETLTDCIAVQYTTDCCGSYAIMGINAGAEAELAAVEMECAPLPVCDCAPQWTTLDDGSQIPYGDTNYALDCLENRCQTAYQGAIFACGDISCTEEQYCTLIYPGQPDAPTTASCSALGDCTSCDCLPAGVGCGCSQDDAGNITVTCALP